MRVGRQWTSVLFSMFFLSAIIPTAYPANGDLVGTVHFSIQCDSGLGLGIAFDGVNLWYSCYGSSVDLLRANPKTGQVTASYTIANGLGALAYDSKRNAIWAGWGGTQSGSVFLINLDANKNVTSSVVRFNSGLGNISLIDDGFAYDGQDDTLYISPDGSTTIYHYGIGGNLLDSRPWAGNSCYNSGLAIGGNLLYQGSDGCSEVWVTDKKTNVLQFTFSTAVAGDPNFRDEGLGCDTSTFAAQGKHVMWSKEAYTPARAAAFEIPFGSCGSGGQLVGITAIDPIPNLLTGPNIGLNTDQLATIGQPVTGVAADGVTQVVIRIPAMSANRPFLVTLLNDQGLQSSSPDADGVLGSLGSTLIGSGGSSSINTTAVTTIAGPMAFLLYRAPIDFVRATMVSDSSATHRSVSLKVVALDTNANATVPLTVLRPPVVLIHGLWGDPSDWNTFTPLVSDPRFSISRVNYNIQYVTISGSSPSYGDASILSNATNNTLGFAWNSNHVIAQITAAINSFKSQHTAAAVQADIVAHSMGGDISRTLPLKPSFSASTNYNSGIIHKLITVGTPHLGTPLAGDLLDDKNKCVRDTLASNGNVAFSSVTVLKATINGAVGDLMGDGNGNALSDALKNIKNAPARLWTAMIAGVMDASQLNGLSCGPFCHAAYIRFNCKGNPLADNLTVSGWPTIVGKDSDSIVPVNSQINGKTSLGIQMTPAIHSAGMESLDFSAPSELDSASSIPDKVITLLNTTVTTTGTFVKQ